MIEPAKEIIKQIKSIIPLSLQKTSSITMTRSKHQEVKVKVKINHQQELGQKVKHQ